MSVSQKDIATKLDLSIATVCRSLQGHPSIHPETRKKVINLASRLGYRPRFNFRQQNASSSRKLISVGVLVCWSDGIESMRSRAAYHMLAGMSEAAVRMNVSLDTQFVPPERCHQITDPQNQFLTMRADTLSGLILMYGFPVEAVRDLAGIMPCVNLVHPHLDLGVDCIDNDHVGGMEMVVNHLHGLGHRKIGFLAKPNSRAWVFRRFAGYMQAMERLGLDRDSSIAINIFNPDFDNEAVADAIVEHRRNGVTAWVCADDYIGYDLFPLLIERGLRVPQDVSITGFSGLEPPHPNYPRLTSVHPPFGRMGAAAVRQLLNRIKHSRDPACHLQFGCEFVKGETTTPPAKQ